MKDIVNNRRRIGLIPKLKTAVLALRENGPRWCAYLAAYYAASTVADGAFAAMDRLRRKRNLPGLNSAALNKHIWESWDWSADGNEWNQSEEWKASLIRTVMEPFVPQNAAILEIGPGGGRWTEHLLPRARTYVGIDISSSCVEHCRARFSRDQRAQFLVGSGRDLEGVATNSIDAIWSFDVFVHINSVDVESYVAEFERVLRPGAIAVIHHGSVGGSAGGWRSDLTAAGFDAMVTHRGLQVLSVISELDQGAEVRRLTFDDLITVISKPAGTAPSSNHG